MSPTSSASETFPSPAQSGQSLGTSSELGHPSELEKLSEPVPPMTSTVIPLPIQKNLAELSLVKEPAPEQLDNIKAQIDLVLLALEAIANIGSEAMLQAASSLGLESVVADRVALWRLRQSSPLRKGQGGRKKLDVEEARALVLISCHLAKEHQELIRRAVALLEQLTEQNQAPHQAALLGDYLDRFQNTYQERMDEAEAPSSEILTHLALKLLIDLLFYSGNHGARRLWSALLERSL
jgi:Protein of unknown function (DUF3038)